MSTTSIIIEHLISGLQAAIWIILIIFTFIGYDWIDIAKVKELSTLITFIGFAFVYPLGIFVDDLSDKVFHKWMKKIRKKRFIKEGIKEDKFEATAFYLLRESGDDFLRNYFNYIRMRIRISRSASINFLFCTVTAIAFTLAQFSLRFVLVVIELVVGGGLTLMAIFVWSRITDTFAKQIVRAYKANIINDKGADL